MNAVKLLLAGEIKFYTFLAIDPRLVVKAVESTYRDTMIKAGITGYNFIDKIVQIPFVIPKQSNETKRKYINSLIKVIDYKKSETNDIDTIEETNDSVTYEESSDEENQDNSTSNENINENKKENNNIIPNDVETGFYNNTISEFSMGNPDIDLLLFEDDEIKIFDKYAIFLDSNCRRVIRLVNVYILTKKFLSTI